MIDFHRLSLSQREDYEKFLFCSDRQGCEYSFANLFLWGRQKAAFREDFVLLFSNFGKHSIYPFPVGCGDPKPMLDAVIADARKRGIAFRLSCLTAEDCDYVQQHYPDRFRFHLDRDHFDYVYAIDDLADLAGRKYQRKRNHLHRFHDAHPNTYTQPLTAENCHIAKALAEDWYADRLRSDPEGDFILEQTALDRLFANFDALKMEGMILFDGEIPLAFTMASRLSQDTFDVHFEKAAPGFEEAYPAINQSFARYLREKYPQIRYLNREDDMGIPGLRKAKESYCPHHMVEKYWARLWEDEDEN